MIVIAILLLILGGVGLIMSTMAFGDIGVAIGVASLTAILSGIGFILANKNEKSTKKVAPQEHEPPTPKINFSE